MNARQKRFAEEYLIDLNATRAAVAAGYSEKYAGQNADKLLKNTKISQFISEKMEEISSEKVATAQEVLEYLTKAIRFELDEEVVVVVDGSPQIIRKKISLRDANTCAQMLAKRHRLLIDKVEADINRSVIFEGENELED